VEAHIKVYCIHLIKSNNNNFKKKDIPKGEQAIIEHIAIFFQALAKHNVRKKKKQKNITKQTKNLTNLLLYRFEQL
jgi:hypothetical protein